jgi:hypothetical protein
MAGLSRVLYMNLGYQINKRKSLLHVMPIVLPPFFVLSHYMNNLLSAIGEQWTELFMHLDRTGMHICMC